MGDYCVVTWAHNIKMNNAPKTKALALAVSAIQKLQEVRGSTSRDIVHYITRNFGFDEDVVGKQVHTSLKRGFAYGILRREGGFYSFPTETDAASEEIAAQEIDLIEMCSRRRCRRRKVKKCGRRGAGQRCCGKSCPCRHAESANKKSKRKSDKYMVTRVVDQILRKSRAERYKNRHNQENNNLYRYCKRSIGNVEVSSRERFQPQHFGNQRK